MQRKERKRRRACPKTAGTAFEAAVEDIACPMGSRWQTVAYLLGWEGISRRIGDGLKLGAELLLMAELVSAVGPQIVARKLKTEEDSTTTTGDCDRALRVKQKGQQSGAA